MRGTSHHFFSRRRNKSASLQNWFMRKYIPTRSRYARRQAHNDKRRRIQIQRIPSSNLLPELTEKVGMRVRRIQMRLRWILLAMTFVFA
jgi:hypothetical protein